MVQPSSEDPPSTDFSDPSASDPPTGQVDSHQVKFRLFIYQISESNMGSRQWISRLSETFYPSWFRLGSIANFDLGSIPEAPRAFEVVKQWCLILLYSNGYRLNDSRLLTTVHQVFNLYIQLNKQKPLNLISVAPLTKYCSHLPISRRNFGDSYSSIILELAHCLSAIDVECVSRGIFFVK